MSSAWLFPGHGSQYVGMGRALLRDTVQGRDWLALAENISGLPLGRLMERGPLLELTRPTVLEPLLACVSCAYVDWLVAAGMVPSALAGYSAGEVAAMYAAGIFDAQTCLRISCLRGAALEQAALLQPGSMMSLSGLPLADLLACLDNDADVAVAAYNGPRHVTVSGTATGLSQATARARNAGAQTGRLDVAGPWHTELVAAACRRLHADLAECVFAEPKIPVWLGSTGATCCDPVKLRASLADSIVLPVQWQTVVEGLVAGDIEAFLEVGPGHILCGLLGQMPLPRRIITHFVERQGMVRLRLPLNFNIKKLG